MMKVKSLDLGKFETRELVRLQERIKEELEKRKNLAPLWNGEEVVKEESHLQYYG